MTVSGGEEGRLYAHSLHQYLVGQEVYASEITSENTLVVSSGNTLQLSVDGTCSGTITLPAANSLHQIAADCFCFANSNYSLTLAFSNASGKSVSVKWTGTRYELVSNTGRQTYSVSDTNCSIVLR